MAKKLIIIFLSICLCVDTFMFIICTQKEKDSGVTINVYNWGEYISNGTNATINVNEEFTKQTGIKVKYNTFQNNEELFAKLTSKGADYDVIIPSDYMIDKLIKKNMLKKLNFNNIPNISLIDKNFINPVYDPSNEYSVPYTWGTVGIFYNKNMVNESEDEISWDILWNEKYKGKILMFDNSRDAFGISLIRLKKSVNTINNDDWYKAKNELVKQKPLVQAYVMDQIFDKMSNEEAALAPYYSGDAFILTNMNKNIGFVIPKEGTTKFIDAMCIPASSMHQNEAEKYINFMCSTKIAKANIEYIGYSTPQKEVKDLLDPVVSQSKIFYPDDEVLKNTQVFKNLPEDINLLINELWIKVKMGESDSTTALICIFVFFIVLYIAVVLHKKRKNKKYK